MATAKKSTRTFEITFKIVAEIGVEVTADTLENAIASARAFKLGDIVGLDGVNHIDSKGPEISWVTDNGVIL